MDAAARQHAACVRELLPVTDLSVSDKQGRNAFHVCTIVGSMECFELLLPLMSDVDVRTVPGVRPDGSAEHAFDCTALHLACSFGQHYMAKALLRCGALRTARDSNQHTPLHHASQCGHASCVALLLGKPGRYKLTPDEVNAADVNGWTPLHLASFYGHENICGTLIAGDARLDAITSRGRRTPLMLAHQKHPANTALLDVLAGRGPAHPPGTVCDRCSRPETESELRACSSCLVARFCSSTCARAAWPGHKAECRQMQTAREERCRPRILDL